METTENTQNLQNYPDSGPSRSGRVMGGLVIVAAGAVLMARQLGVVFPAWLFTWEMLLIVIGIYTLLKHSFRRVITPFVLISIGSVFLLDNFFPEMAIGHLFWPALIIIIGLAVMFKPRNPAGYNCRKRGRYEHWQSRFEKKNGFTDRSDSGIEATQVSAGSTANDPGEFLELTTIFGGNQRNVFSKNFQGGEIVTVFGGTELNLIQAEIEGVVVLDVTAVFGGIKMLVPSHWQIRSELVSFLGGIEDKRSNKNEHTENPPRILILRGNAVFGGIEIKSF